jgi:hypothetical protein
MFILDEKDSQLIAALSKKELNVRSLARTTGISRTTVAYRLQRLATHRLISEKPSPGKQTVWTLATSNNQRDKHIQVFHGDDVLRAHALLLKLRKGETMYTIESYDYIRRLNKKGSAHSAWLDLGRKIQQKFRRSQIILKTIAHADIPHLFASDKHLFDIFLDRHKRKKTSVRLLRTPASLMGPCGYYFTQKRTFIFNEEQELAIVITDEQTSLTLFDMMGMLYELCEPVPTMGTLNMQLYLEYLAARLAKKKDSAQ